MTVVGGASMAHPQGSSSALGRGSMVLRIPSVLCGRGAAAGCDPVARWVLGTPAFAGAGKPEDDSGGVAAE